MDGSTSEGILQRGRLVKSRALHDAACPEWALPSSPRSETTSSGKVEKSGAGTWPIQGAQPASLPSNPFRLGDLVKGKPERHHTSRLCSYPSSLQISLIKDYALVQRVAPASKSFLRMAVWTRSMISSPQDTFSRELLQLLSTDCTPSCFNEHKARAAKKSANVGISICILLPVPPDQLQTWQETREEKFLAASRFCWNTLQSFSTTYSGCH